MNPYDDIINLPRHVSASRPQMPVANRAAQFAPFAALTGFDAAIEEATRVTDKRIELDENALAALDAKLGILAEMISAHPEVAITYFQPDEKKDGGAYVTAVGAVKRIDDYADTIILVGGESVLIKDILDIECDELNVGCLES